MFWSVLTESNREGLRVRKKRKRKEGRKEGREGGRKEGWEEGRKGARKEGRGEKNILFSGKHTHKQVTPSTKERGSISGCVSGNIGKTLKTYLPALVF